MIEIVYRWPNGRKEVRYRRAAGSAEAAELISQVDSLRAKHGDECPYSYRDTSTGQRGGAHG